MANLSRRLPTGASALRRIFFAKPRSKTVVYAKPTAKTPPPPQLQDGDRLYRRLSDLRRNTGMVASTINEYIREGRTVHMVELDKCVDQLRRNKRYADALEMMEWMESQKLIFKHNNYTLLLDLIAKAKGIAAAEDYFNGLSQSMRVECVYCALLKCYCDEFMTDKALDLFAKMVQENVITGPLPFNNLMSMYSRMAKLEKVLVLGEEMKKAGIRMDTFTYNLLMNCYAKLNDVEGVERVFNEMKLDSTKECDWTSYSNLAKIYIKAGSKYQEKAKLTLQHVEKEMGLLDLGAYHFLISSYASLSDLDQVHRVWKLLKSRFAVVKNRSYLVMIQALANLGEIEEVRKCYVEWESGHAIYDISVDDAVIRAYLRYGMLEEAEKVLEAMMSRSEGPFLHTWEQFMLFHLNSNQIERALQVMETATSEAHEIKWPPRFTVDKFLDYFKKESDVDSAEKFYKLMKRINCVDSRLYEALLETYKSSGQTACDLRARIEGDGVEISSEIEHLLESVVCPE